MIDNGFYIIKDEFFDMVDDKNLKKNKGQNRPIIIDKRLSNNQHCDILHIARLDNGKKSVFLIQDMIGSFNLCVLYQHFI